MKRNRPLPDGAFVKPTVTEAPGGQGVGIASGPRGGEGLQAGGAGRGHGWAEVAARSLAHHSIDPRVVSWVTVDLFG